MALICVLSHFQRFIGDITKILGINLPSTAGIADSKLQPTIGVSFGLPNNQNNQANYGGYQQNPLGTGPAINPYTGGSGLSIGALDINPLVSFQATTNDAGELVNKPLINLHVTPNGCGLFGCENYEEPSFQSSFVDTIFGTRREERPKRRRPNYEQLTPSPVYYEDYPTHQQPPNQQYHQPQNQQYHQPQNQQHHQPQNQQYQPNNQRYQSQNQQQYQSHNQQQPQYQEQQYHQQQTHQPPVYHKQQQTKFHHSKPSTKVRFGTYETAADEGIVKHEHHHYHHHEPANQNRFREGGINFAYNKGEEGAYFRTINDTTEESNNQVKSFFAESEKNIEKPSASAFKFPSRDGKILTKRSADHETIQSVGPQPCFKQQQQQNPTNNQLI
jgi:hypothetical protein